MHRALSHQQAHSSSRSCCLQVRENARSREEDDSAPRRTPEGENDPVAVLPFLPSDRGDRDNHSNFSSFLAHLPPLNPPIDPPHEYRRRLLHRDRLAWRRARSSPGPRRGPRHRRVLLLLRRRRLHLSSSTPAAPHSLPSPRLFWSWGRPRDPLWPFPEEEVRIQRGLSIRISAREKFRVEKLAIFLPDPDRRRCSQPHLFDIVKNKQTNKKKKQASSRRPPSRISPGRTFPARNFTRASFAAPSSTRPIWRERTCLGASARGRASSART